MIPRKKYIEAMAVLERDGWRKGSWANNERHAPRCAIGALAVVMRRTPDNIHTYDNVEAWNDAPDTTYEDVLTLLALGAAGGFE